ncbi:hypothetical protein FRB90_001958 [Tulasnella sp. 427]|nr:hypothetical protein FRB90_001958 [Tulasnella sp. 427]
MPAFAPSSYAQTNVAKAPMPEKPLVGHVNMQLDCFLANSNVDDLRAIVRTLLATGPAGTTAALTKIARKRIPSTIDKRVKPANTWFTVRKDGLYTSTPALEDTLKAARTLMGVGLGFDSLPILTEIVEVLNTIEFDLEDETMEEDLSRLDSDIAQACQSSREQIASGQIDDRVAARENLEAMKEALEKCRLVHETAEGDFPLEKAEMAVEGKWRI